MPQSILYYPTINIEDSAWLRDAALYWDEVCSIVPYHGYPDLSAELMYMQERGQYRPIYPQELFRAHNADELYARLQRCLDWQRKKSTTPSRGRLHVEKLPQKEYKRSFNPDLASLLHYRKLPENLYDSLVTRGIAVPVNDEWLDVDEEFERIYMRLLAMFSAKYDESDMVIGTDKARELDDIYHRFPNRDNGNNATVVLTFDKCFPAPAANIGFEQILDFKEEYRAELLELRQKIREYECALSRCTSIEEMKGLTAAFRESWEIQLADAEHMFRGRGIGFAPKTLRAFVTDAGATAGLVQGIQALGVIPISPVLFGAVVGMSGLIGVSVQHRNYKNKINDKLQEGGFAYIIKAYTNGLIRKEQITQIL